MSYSDIEAKSIQSLCTIIDCEHKTAPYVDMSEFLVVRTSNVRNGHLIMDDMKYTTQEGYDEWTQRAIPIYGDVLFTREAPAGESCLVPRGFKVCMGQRMVMLRPKKEKVDPIFLSLILATEKSKSNISRLSIGSTVSRINIADIKQLRVPAPPLSEQRKIAQILSTWDSAISVTEKLLTTSEQQKKALMQQLLTGKKRLLDKNGLRFSGVWESLRLKELILEEKERNKNNRINRVLSVTNRSGFVLPEEQFSKRVASEDVSTYKIVKKSQFGYNPSRLNVGSFARLDDYDVGLLSPMYVVFSIDSNRLNSDFFHNWMKSNEAKQRIAGSTQGSVRESVGFDALCGFPFSLPSIKEQQKIAAVLSAADAEISTLEKKLTCLKNEKKALMQQLLTGKRRVTIDVDAA